MLGALTLVLVVAVSVVITRVATVALTLTGLSRETARFQARSALTGVGFTTGESEQIVGHPVRRRIVMLLMLMGSAGIVTVVATSAVSFADIDSGMELGASTLTLLVGLGCLWWASSSRAVDKALQPLIHRLLRRYTDLDTRDYASLLQIHGDYAVSELAVEEGDWLAGATLADLRLGDEGVLVLGMLRRGDDDYHGAPRGGDVVRAGDTLVLYGTSERLADIDERPAGRAGEAARVAAVEASRRQEAAHRPGRHA